MTGCRHCGAVTVRATVLCEMHYVAALDAAREELCERPKRKGRAIPKKTAEVDQATADERLAVVLARSVAGASEPVADLAGRLRVPNDDALARVIELAKANDWIAATPDGYVKGSTTLAAWKPGRRPTAKKATGRSRIDRQQLAQQISDYVNAADTHPVTARQLSAHLGVSRAVIAEGAAIALANGSIRSVVGAGPKLSGYYAPEADDRAAWAKTNAIHNQSRIDMGVSLCLGHVGRISSHSETISARVIQR